MANRSIYEKIENKGALDASEILNNGQQKAQEIEDTILKNAKKEAELILQKANNRSRDHIKTQSTMIEQNAKQRTLLKKKDFINKTFDLAHQELLKIDDEKLVDYVVKMIQLEKINGNEAIEVSKEDYSRFSKLFTTGLQDNGYYVLDILNKKLGNNYKLKLSSKYADINGGFIIVGENFDIDLSYKTILERIKEEHETEIANILFDSEE